MFICAPFVAKMNIETYAQAMLDFQEHCHSHGLNFRREILELLSQKMGMPWLEKIKGKEKRPGNLNTRRGGARTYFRCLDTGQILTAHQVAQMCDRKYASVRVACYKSKGGQFKVAGLRFMRAEKPC